jgi:hypothetical protein
MAANVVRQLRNRRSSRLDPPRAVRPYNHGADTRVERAKTALGLPQFGSDWGAAWNHLRAAAVQALDTIREEISPLGD